MKKNDKPTNWFDDGILDDDRVRRVIRGRRSRLHLREYNKGEGDWETFCRSVALLKGFYKPQGRKSRSRTASNRRRIFACLLLLGHPA